MEEWAELRDDEHGGGNVRGNFWFDFDVDFPIEKYRFDPCKERLRGLFDQLLVAFMKEKSACSCIRPIPALCGDGRPVDLFKIFWVVRKIGGHDAVTRKELWGFVSDECGLGIGVVSSVRLIHKKYLNELDQWLRQGVSKRASEPENGALLRKLDLLSRELKIRFKNLFPDEKQEKNSNFVADAKARAYINLDSGKNEQVDNMTCFFIEDEKLRRSGNDHSAENMKCELHDVHVDIDQSSNDLVASAKRVVKNATAKKRVVKKAVENRANGFYKGQVDDDIENSSNKDNGTIMASAKNVVKNAIRKTHDLSEGIDTTIRAKSEERNVMETRKRKRKSQSYSEMLNWLIHVAKHPDDPSVGLIPECSKWSDYGNEELWVQAVCVRDALLIRRYANTSAGENLIKDQQKKPRMHPTMYQDDFLVRQSSEKVRCSKRVPTLAKSHFCPCCITNAAESKTTVHQEANNKNTPKKEQLVKLVLTDVDELPKNSDNFNPMDVPAERQVSVGPLFQAELPEWTSVITESDPKWLGTTMWVPNDDEKNPLTGLDPVGKGRSQQSCDCSFRGSVECVRFHVAEKRLKLKCELGSLFHHWRFDRMGEEVSLSWTEEEEQKFKDMMRSYASFPNKFWKNAPRLLPSKTREKLVSYYFNVFVIHRRSYQNRVTPKDVDSDDDEKACGAIGGYFGYKALHVPRSSVVSCTLNEKSYDLV